MRWSLKLITVSGIPIFIHWSFSLLLLYVIFQSSQAGLGLLEITLTTALLFVVFLCVTLHELGHALAARRYGISTQDITLLPIGGLARLTQLPEKPIQELVVAVAGPLVNVVIAGVLFLILWLTGNFQPITEGHATPQNFLMFVLIVNIFLVVFNMIPAFPMDGGRVFRALLSMKFSRLRATQVASILGKVLSVGFVIVGLGFYPGADPNNTNPFLAIIGGFIYLGAGQEYKMVRLATMFEGLKVRDFMDLNFPFLLIGASIEEAENAFNQSPFIDLPVFSPLGLEGMLPKEVLIKSMKKPGNDALEALIEKGYYKVRANDPLKEVYLFMQQKAIRTLPVYDNGALLGLIRISRIAEEMKKKKI